ncbi:XRE family transcriptional regulator [Pseudoflavonifractor sp. 60]|uniref:helix-turn-helix domain-containing protein n=1 Tax=Pseudoflavonifractor sp. 60 TaxID=2304576 RepID=UPI00136A2F02|nr:helix-turn-helix transcriptional regulator [Pseudoflavonifractor sp. 60]NBI66879.1 XRE family transcriptional regulator [Pseudoflavonifractor sp. 60]
MEKKMLVEFGKRLKSLRQAKGLKQIDMAGIMGITDRHYQRFEYGKVNVPATTLNFFADFFGVTTDYLLGREERQNTTQQKS